jgi:hypothetical protein
MQTQISHSTLNFGITADTMLAILEENFQHFDATPNDSMETIMYRSGQRSVVEYIKQLLEEES